MQLSPVSPETILNDEYYIKISDKALDLQECFQFVTDPGCGAILSFVGTVRNTHGDKKVTFLEFEVYASMAVREMNRIAQTASKRWPCQKIAVHHRVGRVDISELPVIIVLSTPHRSEGFKACEFIIDKLKKTVPIWKTEYYEGHAPFTQNHP